MMRASRRPLAIVIGLFLLLCCGQVRCDDSAQSADAAEAMAPEGGHDGAAEASAPSLDTPDNMNAKACDCDCEELASTMLLLQQSQESHKEATELAASAQRERSELQKAMTDQIATLKSELEQVTIGAAEHQASLMATAQSEQHELKTQIEQLQRDLDASSEQLKQAVAATQAATDETSSVRTKLEKELETIKSEMAEMESKSKQNASHIAEKAQTEVSTLQRKIDDMSEVIRRAKERNDALRNEKQQYIQTTDQQTQKLLQLTSEHSKLRLEYLELLESHRAMERDTWKYRMTKIWNSFIHNPEIQMITTTMHNSFTSSQNWQKLLSPTRDGYIAMIYYRIQRFTHIIMYETMDFLYPILQQQHFFKKEYDQFHDALFKYNSILHRYCILQNNYGFLYQLSVYVEQNTKQVGDSILVIIGMLTVMIVSISLIGRNKKSNSSTIVETEKDNKVKTE